jgi:hypothetical protein
VERVLREIHRILAPEGWLYLVEPWQTPFLTLVHAVCRWSWACRLWPKLDALATMIRHEQATYEAWLGQGPAILDLLERSFEPVFRQIAWGKLLFAGRRK